MTSAPTAVARCRLRTPVQWCVLVLLAVGLVQTWFIDGLAVPCRVAGGSMAGALLGIHRNVVCGDCGYPFPCGTDVLPAATRAVCPNCGYVANDLELLPDVDGDRVLIDRAAFSIRAPRRWEIVACRRSPLADNILVKRVVGLPGESVEIRHGDVYIDGQVLRKNLAEQRALAVLVYDADYLPTREPSPPPRWRAEKSDSRWSAAGGRFIHAAGPDRERSDWLVYHNWRRQSCSVRESPVTDLCGYNPLQPRREEDVHAVTDLMLSFRLGNVSGRGTFCVRIADGRDCFEARLRFDNDRQRNRGSIVKCTTACLQAAPEQRITSYTACKQAVAHGEIPGTSGDWLVEVSLADQQFLLALDGETVVAWPYDRPEPPRHFSSCPLAIGAEGIAVTVRDLQVYRDVYYTQPIGARGRRGTGRPMRLAAEEYYVLGDNSPVSEDSRTWAEQGAIDAKLLAGKPLVAIPSVSLSLGERWHFQVPNPTGIRYIR